MWRAAKRIWGILLLFVLIEWAIGSFFFVLLRGGFNYFSIHPALSGLITGVLTAFAPTALEVSLLPAEGATVEKVQKRLTKLLVRMKVMLRYNYAHAIESCRQQDLYDIQHTNSWIPGVTSQQIRRRLRILYENCKVDIAEHRKTPGLLQFDVDYAPWGKFYLLVRHLGRRKLRQYLQQDLESPCPDWDGSERRRIRGTKGQRQTTTGSTKSRIYDDIDYMRRIDRGRISMKPPPAPEKVNESSPSTKDSE